MKTTIQIVVFTLMLSLATSASVLAFGGIGDDVNANCPSQPYTGDCTLCHVSGNFSATTPAKDAAAAGDWCFFCSSDAVCQPTGPTCTDADGDMFFAEGGDCGPRDCDDNDPAVNPGAAERCSDGIDNNCDGLTDGQDTQTCPAPEPTCTDLDQDGFYAQTDCNTVQDCNDADASIYPGATEVCADGVDNDCDGMIDEGCESGGSDDGEVLYRQNCAACHSILPESDVCGEDAEEIMEAIADNEGGMGTLSSLTDQQIEAIAESLKDCERMDKGDDEDDEDEKDKDEDKEKDEDKDKKDKKKHKKDKKHDD